MVTLQRRHFRIVAYLGAKVGMNEVGKRFKTQSVEFTVLYTSTPAPCRSCAYTHDCHVRLLSVVCALGFRQHDGRAETDKRNRHVLCYWTVMRQRIGLRSFSCSS